MWRHFAGRDFPLEVFCKRLFPAEGFVRGGILPQSPFQIAYEGDFQSLCTLTF